MYMHFNLDAVSFAYGDASVREDEAMLYIKVVLERPATSSRTIQIHSYLTGDNATGEIRYTT